MNGRAWAFTNSFPNIHLEPEGVELASVRAGEWTEVAVPPLAVHSLGVAEF